MSRGGGVGALAGPNITEPPDADGASFHPTPEGWLRATPSDETLAWARRMEAEGDKTKPNDMRNFSKRRYQGFVGERAFDVWLRSLSVTHEWHGQTDAKPDFELGAVSVGLKSCGSKRAWRPDLVVNVYERHREHPLRELFFAGFEHPGAVKQDRPTVVLLGGLPTETYFELATFVSKGEQLNPKVIAENDVWNLRTSKLEAPQVWLERVLR